MPLPESVYDKLDKIWTALEAVRVDLATVKTVVTNDHEHRLSRLETVSYWILTSLVLGLFGIILNVLVRIMK